MSCPILSYFPFIFQHLKADMLFMLYENVQDHQVTSQQLTFNRSNVKRRSSYPIFQNSWILLVNLLWAFSSKSISLTYHIQHTTKAKFKIDLAWVINAFLRNSRKRKTVPCIIDWLTLYALPNLNLAIDISNFLFHSQSKELENNAKVFILIEPCLVDKINSI